MSDARTVVTIDADLEPLMPGYLERRQQDIANIRSSLSDGDFAAIQVIGHNLKGSGLGYGFERISTLGGELELAAKEQDTELCRSQMIELDDYLRSVELRFE